MSWPAEERQAEVETSAVAEERPRRRQAPEPPDEPKGYRASRRVSKAARSAKRAKRVFRARSVIHRSVDGANRTIWVAGRLLLLGAGVLAALVLVLLLLANGINSTARWLAERRATSEQSGISSAARENLLVIGVEGERATGFLALRVSEEDGQVYGLAIPDGAFVEVPGQGFERIGDSFHAGPEVSMAAVTNYLTVPFERHVVVDASVYEQVMQKQSVAGLLAAGTATDLTDDEASRLRDTMDGTPPERVLIVALPVKPISLGDETYFEPRREEVADLLRSWWGVSPGGEEQPVRVIVYNGSGVPGIAGQAARELIRDGFRVVDTKNADTFDYDETLIVVQRPGAVDPKPLKELLGVGEVVNRESEQRIADVIVIIGKDYAPPQDG